MKKMLFLAVLGTILGTNCIEAGGIINKSNYGYGVQKFGKEIVDSIEVNGSVILEGTKILGLVKVNGSLKAEESAIDSLQVNGQADLSNCVISKTTLINGSLNAANTKFENELSVASQKIVLRMCTVDSLTMREVTGYTGVQVVDLRSGTKVTGPIIVEAGNGEIWISSNSEISAEQVIGAKVLRK